MGQSITAGSRNHIKEDTHMNQQNRTQNQSQNQNQNQSQNKTQNQEQKQCR